MPELNRTVQSAKNVKTEITEIRDGIYRISGFVDEFGITFNQFLIDDEQPTLIHTGPVGMYEQVEQRVKEVISPDKLSYVAFLHFESDEWGGMEFLKAPKVRLVCSELSSKLNLMGWYNIPADHLAFWDNERLKTGKRSFRFIMTPHVHHWDSMMMFEETTKSLFPSDLFIQPGKSRSVASDDLSESMIALYRGAGIFASEQPVRKTVRRLESLEPEMTYPMHGSCFDKSMFKKYSDALMENEFAFSDVLLGKRLEIS